MSDDAGKGGVRSVQLALDVLERVASAGDGVGVSELAVQLGTTKGSVFRHLKTLVDRFIPGVTILSHNEIAANVNVKSIGTVVLK